ncbi:acyltransferase family protein [Actinokineospora globicatena]|uniref:acyltransferase family protein n=1 Tax=Actinokineospora globicatena TaxID=103729 RepID=UPI0020A44B08|nr:acyltransferase [Actinokineospora globicatena]MCP2301121.1 Peptidoglycan/LPS O-acetylase OafA/YrhL, contains acyltransferase and SGNH-hydrolase domains [Actinokineospora globicatena]GLW77243.1 acyltransferase [Actinokineospora globicatena]GLW84077.1 acyltransferase [Actinokineospora globicatena]
MRPITHADYLAMRRFDALDGLRAIAAVLVVFSHFAGPELAFLNGFLGVDLFFVISGFLITTLALREEVRNTKISIKEFYIRRAFRILPAYYVILAAVAAILWLRDEYTASGMPGHMPYYLWFNQELAPPNWWFGQSWTLGIEQKFYIVWPLLLAATFMLRPAWRMLGTAALMASTFFLLPYASPYLMIMIGCQVAFLLNSAKGFRVLRPLTHPLMAPPIAVAVLLVQINMPYMWEWKGGLLPVILYTVLCAALVIATLGPGPMQWVLTLRPMVFVGERSYSLYLLQNIAGFAVAAAIPQFAPHGLTTAVVVTIVGVFMADVVYRRVELPMIALGRKLIVFLRARKLERTSAEPTPALAG